MKYCMSFIRLGLVAAIGTATLVITPPALGQQAKPSVSAELPPPATLPNVKAPYPVTQRAADGATTAAGTVQGPAISITLGQARIIAFPSNIIAAFFSDGKVIYARALHTRTMLLTGRAAGQATVTVLTQRNPKDVTGVANVLRVTVKPAQEKPTPAKFDVSEVTEISVQRTPCMGDCPVDQLVLRSDGTATYTGVANVERMGNYTGTFYKRPPAKPEPKTGDFGLGAFELPEGVDELVATPPDYFTGLVELMQLNKFFERKASYGEGEDGFDDFSAVIISAVRKGERKTVTNRTIRGSIALWGIEMAMRGVAADIKWQKVE